MLKTQTVTAILHRSRLNLALNTASTPTASPAYPVSKMSTTENAIRVQPPLEATEELRQGKPQQVKGAYFPLGYKEAAYQWVCFGL
jgi:cardiolipin-specific phospholipase